MPTARTAPRKTTPSVDFDIEVAEAEFDDEERPDPFRVKLRSGKVVTFIDPAKLDWQVAYALDRTAGAQALEAIVPEEDLEDFLSEKMSQAVLERLMRGYLDRYGLIPAGE